MVEGDLLAVEFGQGFIDPRAGGVAGAFSAAFVKAGQDGRPIVEVPGEPRGLLLSSGSETEGGECSAVRQFECSGRGARAPDRGDR